MRTLDELGISPAPWAAKSLHDLMPHDTDASDVRRYVFARAKYEGEYDNGVTTICHKVIKHAEADARLIAAAPECYSSLCEMLTALKNRLPSQPTLDELEIIDRAEAAIRKATGESEVAK